MIVAVTAATPTLSVALTLRMVWPPAFGSGFTEREQLERTGGWRSPFPVTGTAAENSEVLPLESVAVALMNGAAAVPRIRTAAPAAGGLRRGALRLAWP